MKTCTASIATVLALSVLVSPAVGQTAAELVAQRYQVDPMHSTVAFTSTILRAVHVRGRFTDYDASIVYDPKHVERSSVTAIIKVTSLNTDMDFRDNHLRSPDFFDVKQFPTIEFTSDRVAPVRGGMDVFGTLTMHGVARPIRIPAKLVLAPRVNGTNVTVAFTAELKMSRKDYGIAGSNAFNPDYNPATNMLSDSVSILLELDAERDVYTGRKLGTGTPPGVADTVNRVLRARGVDAALDAYRALRAVQPAVFRFTAGQLDVIGHQLAERGEVKSAVKVLAFNAELYGDTPGVLESLGEVQAMANDADGALKTYRRVLARFPDSASAREMIRHLERP
ncbi:MAG TPA: YceI family protein [Gemmatimonadaceae bacterium]|nr:YceI family protein [Gemmatimonadaceae bacterium]